MWDTHNHHHKTEFVDRNISIVEQRAPTNESVALLKEMQEKVQADFIGSFPLPNNLFNATVNVYIEHLHRHAVFLVQYKINYETRKVKIEVPWSDLDKVDYNTNQYMTKLICREIAKDFSQLFNTFMEPQGLGWAPTITMPKADDPKGEKSSEHAMFKDVFIFKDRIYPDGTQDYRSATQLEEDVKNKFEYIKKWTNAHSTHSYKLIEKLKDLWWYE